MYILFGLIYEIQRVSVIFIYFIEDAQNDHHVFQILPFIWLFS